jgi:hypothetical protein
MVAIGSHWAPMTDSPLLAALRARNVLTADEEAMLRSADVLALEPRAQLEHIRTNRSVGRFVTRLAGGVRLTLIAGALVSHVGLVASGELPFAWWSVLVWLGLFGLLAWLVPAFLRRTRELGQPLPTYEELGRPS